MTWNIKSATTPSIINLNTLDNTCGVVFVPGKNGGLFRCIEFPYYATSCEGDKGVRIKQGYACEQNLQAEQSFSAKTFSFGIYKPEKGVDSKDVGHEMWFREYIANISPVYDDIPTLLHHGYGQGDLVPWSENIETYRDLERQLGLKYIYYGGEGNVQNRDINKRLVYQQGLEQLLKEDAVPITNVFWYGSRDCKKGVCFDKFLDEMNEFIPKLTDLGYRGLNCDGLGKLSCSHQNCTNSKLSDDAALFQNYEKFLDVIANAKKAGMRYLEGHIGFWQLGPFFVRDLSVIHAHDWTVPSNNISAAQAIMEVWLEKTKESYRKYLLPAYKYRGQVGYYRQWEKDYPLPEGSIRIGESWNRECGGFHDVIGWRNSLLAAMAFGVNFNFSYLSKEIPAEEIDFAKKWLNWEKDHINELTRLRLISDDEFVDIISKADSDGGFVFCINRDWLDRQVNIKIALSEKSAKQWKVTQLYPHELNLAGARKGYFNHSDSISLMMRPKSVSIFEIRPKTVDSGSIASGAISKDKFYKTGFDKFQFQNGSYHLSFVMPQNVTQQRTNLNAQIPQFVKIENKLPHALKSILASVFSTDETMQVETWKLYPYAYSNKVYLIAEFDKTHQSLDGNVPSIKLNGHTAKLMPRIRIKKDSILTSNLFFTDVTGTIKSGTNELVIFPAKGLVLGKISLQNLPESIPHLSRF